VKESKIIMLVDPCL